MWKAYLTPTLLSSRIFPTNSTHSYGLYGYQPNLVARQFGLIQTRPNSLYKSKKDLKKPKNENIWRSLLQKVDEHVPTLKPIPFELSYECTKTFFRWWRGYFVEQSKEVNPDTTLPELISAFNYVQRKSKKPKGTHLREIQAFQKYFKTVYDPLHLSRTVYNAAKTLKLKLLDKIPTSKFPPFVTDKYLFAL